MTRGVSLRGDSELVTFSFCSPQATSIHLYKEGGFLSISPASSFWSEDGNGIGGGGDQLRLGAVHRSGSGQLREESVGEWRRGGGEAGGVGEDLGAGEAEDRGLQAGAASVHESAHRWLVVGFPLFRFLLT